MCIRDREKGVLTIDKEETDLSLDDLMLLALDAGAEDIAEDDDSFEVTCQPEDFQSVKEGMEKEGVSFSEAEITMVPDTTVEVNDLEQAKFILRMMDTLDDHDDVQNTYTNFDIPDEIADQLS